MKNMYDITDWSYRHETLIVYKGGETYQFYCPSSCLYNDGKGPYYCYPSNMNQHKPLAISSITYEPNKYKTNGLEYQVTCIFFSDTEQNERYYKEYI